MYQSFSNFVTGLNKCPLLQVSLPPGQNLVCGPILQLGVMSLVFLKFEVILQPYFVIYYFESIQSSFSFFFFFF